MAERVGWVDNPPADAYHREAVTPLALDQHAGDPVVGLLYVADFDASQEFGIGDLTRVFTGGDPRRNQMLRGADRHLTFFDDVDGFSLGTHPLPERRVPWGAPLPGIRQGYADAWAERRARDVDTGYRLAILDADPATLRAQARDLGVTGALPRNQGRLRDLVAGHPDRARVLDNPLADSWHAPFAGSTMVLRADTGITRDILRQLRVAAQVGTLGVTPGRHLFASGLFLFDAADETAATIADRHAYWDWHDERMAEVQPVLTALRAKGHRFHFVGRPTERDDGTVRYWLNGSVTRLTPKQPSGWYTLDEIAAEQFAVDAAERAKVAT